MSLNWQNVTCAVKGKKKLFRNADKPAQVILNNVSGEAQKGEMIAIIGASGSGKSTTLNTIGRRNLGDKIITGTITYNGQYVPQKKWRYLCGYVEQDDIFHQNLTVRETLMFNAHLNLPMTVSVADKIARVEQIVNDLNLDHVIDKRVTYLSGGEKKRVSVGAQLVTHPKILLLDEPTSGLDAYTALTVVKMLRKLCDEHGMMIILTIHQPRETIVDLFDKIYVMTKGRVMFCGSVEESIAYLDVHGYPMPKYTNPADFLIDITNSESVTSLVDEWQGQQSNNLTTGENIELTNVRFAEDTYPYATIDTNIQNSIVDDSDIQRPSKWLQGRILIQRNLLNLWRDRSVLFITAGQTVIITILIGLIFFQLGNSQADLQSRYGVLFFICVNQTFSYMMPLVTSFPIEKRLIIREYQSGGYSPSTAFFARFIAQLTIAWVASSFVVVVIYFMVNLRSFWIYYISLELVCISAILLGLTIGAGASSPQMAQAVAPTIAILLILVSGLYANRDTIQPWVAWIQYISFVSYGYQILVQNELTGARFVCPPSSTTCFTTGEQVITFLSMDTPSMFLNFVGLLTFIGVVAILGIVLLNRSVKNT